MPAQSVRQFFRVFISIRKFVDKKDLQCYIYLKLKIL